LRCGKDRPIDDLMKKYTMKPNWLWEIAQTEAQCLAHVVALKAGCIAF